jgi:Flp pilus assembly protein TadG
MNILLCRMNRREQGSVAIEFAVVMTFLLLPLLAATLFFGRFLWHYTVAEKAAHDAARFLASASPTELKMQSPSGEAYVVEAAKALARAEIAELNPGSDFPLAYVFCDSAPCVPFKTTPLPKVVSAYVVMSVEDPFLTPFTSLFVGNTGPIAIQIDATGRSYYVGN